MIINSVSFCRSWRTVNCFKPYADIPNINRNRHIAVNGNVVNIPSYSLREGDVVSVRERSRSLEVITDSLASRANNYPWLEWDGASMSGKFVNYPQRSDIPETINEQLIVDLYSK